MSTARWGRKTLFIGSSSWLLDSVSKISRFSIKLSTEDMIASDAVLTIRIEKILGTRFASRSRSDISVGLRLIARKHEKSELGLSLLEPFCLKLSIRGFTEMKNVSQKSQSNSWPSYLLREKGIIFRHKDRKSSYCLLDTLTCTLLWMILISDKQDK